MSRPKIVGIVNITSDSFSDGGKYMTPALAAAHARVIQAGGADIIELSGVSSNPHSEIVPADVEIVRMEPVLSTVTLPVSIDATKPEVQRWALSKGVAYLNDVRGFPDQSLYPELAASSAKLVVMHMISDKDQAVRAAKTTEEVFESIYSFFETRIPQLIDARIAQERIIIDPGMGMFLSSKAEASYAVLERLAELKAYFKLPVMISVSRKSFLRDGASPDSSETAKKTLAAELTAAAQGVEYIRTHDTRALSEALAAHVD